ncbi:MAG: hypothetical protein EXS38_11440 [Opitutus sp.]|nr:hypothetical protein [Opitutus sp.]
MICLAVAIALVSLLGLATLDSRIQTLIAQTMLERQPGVRGNLGSFSAGLNRVAVAEVHPEIDGARLTLPTLQVRLPVKDPVWDRRFLVRNLVAKGWTLDLSGANTLPITGGGPVLPSNADDQGTTAPSAGVLAAQQAVLIFHKISAGWEFPCDSVIEGVDLEGEILLAALARRTPGPNARNPQRRRACRRPRGDVHL